MYNVCFVFSPSLFFRGRHLMAQHNYTVRIFFQLVFTPVNLNLSVFICDGGNLRIVKEYLG